MHSHYFLVGCGKQNIKFKIKSSKFKFYNLVLKGALIIKAKLE